MNARTRGLLLIAPAVIVWLLGAVWPTVRLVWASFTDNAGVVDSADFSVVNYNFGRLGGPLATALSLVPLPLLLFVVVGLALGVTGRRVGGWGRLTGRMLVAVPAVCFVPAAAAISYLFARGVSDVRVLVVIGAFGFLVVTAATSYLAAFRGGRRAVLVVTGFAVLAAVALAVQQFTIPYLADDEKYWTPVDDGALPVTQVFNDIFDVGAMAADLVVVSAIVAVLGVAAVVLLIGTGTRVAVASAAPAAADGGTVAPHRGARWVYLGVATAVFVAGVLLLLPWLTRLSGPVLPHDGLRVLANTWLAPLPTTVVALLVAVPAGFGIGAVRPFGARSEWLLLPFAPWLFVGVAPYALAAVLPDLTSRTGGAVSLSSPMWFSVPALVLFTLLFRGQAPAYQRARAAGRPASGAFVEAYVRPLWPAVLLTGGVLWLMQANDFVWPKMAEFAIGPGAAAKGTTLNVYEKGVSWSSDGTGVLTPVPMVLFALVVVVVAQFYLDRLAVATQPAAAERAGAAEQRMTDRA